MKITKEEAALLGDILSCVYGVHSDTFDVVKFNEFRRKVWAWTASGERDRHLLTCSDCGVKGQAFHLEEVI